MTLENLHKTIETLKQDVETQKVVMDERNSELKTLQ